MSIDNGIAEALLPIKGLPHDWYNYDEIKQILYGESTGYSFKSGMELKVKITEVSPFLGSIAVKWHSGGIKTVTKNNRKKRRRK